MEIGEEKNKIENEAKKLNIDSRIFFLGIRNDVGELLSAMDLFILPSIYEGAPLSLIEAQKNGIDAIVTSNISKEVLINDNVIPLELIEEKWVNRIEECLANEIKEEERKKMYKNVENQKYDILETANLFENKYYYIGE